MKYTPRPHQVEAHDRIMKHYTTVGDKCIMQIPCRVGKTMVMYMVSKSLTKGKNKGVVLFITSSITLVVQSFREFQKYNNEEKLKSLLFCSGGEKKFYEEHEHIGLEAMSTDVKDAFHFMKGDDIKYIFTTYHSAPKLKPFEFDFIAHDEAHRIAGSEDKNFAECLDIVGKKKLFGTATPKVSKGKKKGEISMDDEKLFGPTAYYLSLTEAIEKNLITDYTVDLFSINRKELPAQVTQAIESGDEEIWLNFIAEKAFREIKECTNMILYFNTLKNARKFVEYHGKFEHFEPVEVFYIDGKMPLTEKMKALEAFQVSKKGILCNVACIQEGTDLPRTNAVMFANPRSSELSILQNGFRAMTNVDGKSRAHIIIPVIYEQDEDLESFKLNEQYKTIVSVFSSLAKEDYRMKVFINSLATPKIYNNLAELTGKTAEEIKNDFEQTKTSIVNSNYFPVNLIGFEKEMLKAIFYKSIERTAMDLWEQFFIVVLKNGKTYEEALNAQRKAIEFYQNGTQQIYHVR